MIITKDGIGIGVEYMPCRKKPCLIVKKNNKIYKYASFNNIASAEKFAQIFTDFIFGKDVEVKDE